MFGGAAPYWYEGAPAGIPAFLAALTGRLR
jgi:hypothetical protein